MSPLQLASLHGRLDTVRYLLDHGADPNCQDDDHRTPLSLAANGKDDVEIVRVLLDNDADANFHDKDGRTLIHRACAYDFCTVSLVRLLLEHGADPNARDNKRRTPLHLASLPRSRYSSALSLRLEIAPVLLAHGANVDAEDDEGRTPLQVALESGQAEMAQLLSEYCSK